MFLYFKGSVYRPVFMVTPRVGFRKMWAPGLVPVKVSYNSSPMKYVLFRPHFPLSLLLLFWISLYSPHSHHIYWHEWKQFNKSIGRGLCFPFKFREYNNLLWVRRNCLIVTVLKNWKIMSKTKNLIHWVTMHHCAFCLNYTIPSASRKS